MIRVRFPPSPTGIPHIGNTRTAFFNYLFARHNKGVFVLRIEDTDQARLVPQAEEAIKEILTWLGMSWDEFYKQSERLSLYQKRAEELLKKNLAKKDEGAIRFIVPKGKTVGWVDSVGNKTLSFQSSDVEDFIILKSDGFPTYHLANVVDDHDMKISHVIRGDEWISSTPKHILLYEAFGWKRPAFVHLPVILGPDRQKLSKRHGAKSALDLRDEGYLPEALLNFMALLGWNPGGDKEIMTRKQMIDLFDLKDINTSPSVFDAAKLKWMNGVYIRQLSIDQLNSKLSAKGGSSFVRKIQKINKTSFDRLVSLAQTRMNTLNDFDELIKPIIEEQKIDLSEDEKKIALQLAKSFSTIEQWNNETILSAIKKVITKNNLKMSIIYKILTGKESGLPLPETLEILGKQKTLDRLKLK